MKKLLSSVSSAVLTLCLTLQLAHAMMGPETQELEGKKECSNLGPKPNKQKNNNKKQYNLLKENFSKNEQINFEKLQEYIHYKFKDGEHFHAGKV